MHEKRRMQAPLGVVQKILAAHPLLRLAPRPSFLSLAIPLGEEVLAKVVGEVLRDEAALGQDELFLCVWLCRIGDGDLDEWRFA